MVGDGKCPHGMEEHYTINLDATGAPLPGKWYYALGKSLVDAQGKPTHSLHWNTEKQEEVSMRYDHGSPTLPKAFAKKHQSIKVRPENRIYFDIPRVYLDIPWVYLDVSTLTHAFARLSNTRRIMLKRGPRFRMRSRTTPMRSRSSSSLVMF